MRYLCALTSMGKVSRFLVRNSTERPGYLGKKHNSFCWLITSSKIDGEKAELQMINDYGSEDLTATLTVENDSLYVLRQVEGSTLKVPKDGKWQKLPSKLVFKRR